MYYSNSADDARPVTYQLYDQLKYGKQRYLTQLRLFMIFRITVIAFIWMLLSFKLNFGALHLGVVMIITYFFAAFLISEIVSIVQQKKNVDKALRNLEKGGDA